MCRRLAGNEADALDATQEALIAIARGIRRFDGRAAFSTWAYRVATNACLDELRRRKRRPTPGPARRPRVRRPERRSAPPRRPGSRCCPTGSPSTPPSRSCRRSSGRPVVLRDLCDLDYAEIAQTLGIPPGTVRSRIARGRAQLAALLDPGNQAAAARSSYRSQRPRNPTMTDHDPLDELASAHLDGATSPEEAAQVAADPALQARVEELRAVRDAVAAVPPVDPARRDAAIAAALAAFEEAGPPEPGRSASVTSLTEVAARRGRSARARRWLGAAAVIALLVALVPLVRQARRRLRRRHGQRAGGFTETGAAIGDERRARRPEAAADGGERRHDRPSAATGSTLGAYDSVDELAAAVRASAAPGTSAGPPDEAHRPVRGPARRPRRRPRSTASVGRALATVAGTPVVVFIVDRRRRGAHAAGLPRRRLRAARRAPALGRRSAGAGRPVVRSSAAAAASPADTHTRPFTGSTPWVESIHPAHAIPPNDSAAATRRDDQAARPAHPHHDLADHQAEQRAGEERQRAGELVLTEDQRAERGDRRATQEAQGRAPGHRAGHGTGVRPAPRAHPPRLPRHGPTPPHRSARAGDRRRGPPPTRRRRRHRPTGPPRPPTRSSASSRACATRPPARPSPPPAGWWPGIFVLLAGTMVAILLAIVARAAPRRLPARLGVRRGARVGGPRHRRRSSSRRSACVLLRKRSSGSADRQPARPRNNRRSPPVLTSVTDPERQPR